MLTRKQEAFLKDGAEIGARYGTDSPMYRAWLTAMATQLAHRHPLERGDDA